MLRLAHVGWQWGAKKHYCKNTTQDDAYLRHEHDLLISSDFDLFALDQETRLKTFAAESFRLGIFRRTCPSKGGSSRNNCMRGHFPRY